MAIALHYRPVKAKSMQEGRESFHQK